MKIIKFSVSTIHCSFSKIAIAIPDLSLLLLIFSLNISFKFVIAKFIALYIQIFNFLFLFFTLFHSFFSFFSFRSSKYWNSFRCPSFLLFQAIAKFFFFNLLLSPLRTIKIVAITFLNKLTI